MRTPNLERKDVELSGVQRLYKFPNGYGASVIRHAYSYGGPEGKWELAVLVMRPERGEWDFDLTYDTPITSDVCGWLTERRVDKLLAQIEALEPVGVA